ncbi:acyl-CoA carboxylase subunit epsilon [Streptomyces sp. NPDC021080]|uniref:acyl-CoA carboxylase subunit epsilon n=1 Tax=Streptomyces sp. NPDC021080 TaxID=3365110 RepID=UPI00379EADC8
MTTAAETDQPLVRVIRGGDILPEELAALTAVLLTRAAAAPDDPGTGPVVPLWDRPTPYRSPASWRN